MPGAARPALIGSANWKEQAAKWKNAEDPIDGAGNGIRDTVSWLMGGGGDGKPVGTEEETQGLLSVAQQGLQNLAGSAGNAATGGKLGTAMQMATIGQQQWMYFGIFFAIGCLLMGLSFMSLPLVVLAPQKFASVFTTGNICFLGSFCALKGFNNFLAHLVSKERLPLTLGYFGSMAGTLWACLWYRSTILTIVCLVAQVSQLLWFFVSYIPGGSSVLICVCDSCSGAMRRACCGCLGGKGSMPL